MDHHGGAHENPESHYGKEDSPLSKYAFSEMALRIVESV